MRWRIEKKAAFLAKKASKEMVAIRLQRVPPGPIVGKSLNVTRSKHARRDALYTFNNKNASARLLLRASVGAHGACRLQGGSLRLVCTIPDHLADSTDDLAPSRLAASLHRLALHLATRPRSSPSALVRSGRERGD